MPFLVKGKTYFKNIKKTSKQTKKPPTKYQTENPWKKSQTPTNKFTKGGSPCLSKDLPKHKDRLMLDASAGFIVT